VTNAQAHRLAREKGVSRPLYAVVRAVLVPFLRGYFRMRISGAQRIPVSGPAIIAPNHKSFWDSFFVAIATPRHLRFMGKSELFEGRWGRLLVRLGAFPVRRGQADQDALDTAREILRQGGLLALFPEGTRVRDSEAGAPLVPAAISGTDHLFAGPFPRPKRVQVAFSDPIPVTELPATPGAAGELIEGRVWPEVEEEFRRMRARPGLIAAGIAALGLGAGGVALRRRRASRRRPFWRR
jgi:1-acyl-sn-glycerol-3-phosphate acyltransferase